MDRALIGMILAMFLSFALGLLVYEGLFSYSFKRRPHFICRAIVSALGIGALATGLAFGLYGLFAAGLDPTVVWKMDLARAGLNMLFVAMGIGALIFCFEERPTLILFAAVAANASLTISTTLYGVWMDAFGLKSIYFSMYNGYDAVSYVLYYLTHAVVIVLAWLIFARPFARAHKEFGKYINKFVLGVYVIYAFFTAAVSGSQFFNRSLMGIDSVAIPIIFNGFSVFFAVFVLFVQRFNLFWVRDVQQQEAAESFHSHYKERADKQQANLELIDAKVKRLKEHLNTILKDNEDTELLDELQKAINLFDTGIQTGNDALDLLFTQKAMELKALRINTSLAIEGKAFSFMDVSDINVFFGNAVDNAMEYLAGVDEEKRFLRISTYRNHSLLYVRIENYCEADVNVTKDGLPRSAADALPGYGTYNIRSIAVKYGGTATFAKEGDLFVVKALLNCNETF